MTEVYIQFPVLVKFGVIESTRAIKFDYNVEIPLDKNLSKQFFEKIKSYLNGEEPLKERILKIFSETVDALFDGTMRDILIKRLYNDLNKTKEFVIFYLSDIIDGNHLSFIITLNEYGIMGKAHIHTHDVCFDMPEDTPLEYRDKIINDFMKILEHYINNQENKATLKVKSIIRHILRCASKHGVSGIMRVTNYEKFNLKEDVIEKLSRKESGKPAYIRTNTLKHRADLTEELLKTGIPITFTIDMNDLIKKYETMFIVDPSFLVSFF